MSERLSFLRDDTVTAFQDESVVAAYDFRPKLHPDTFPFLANLTVGSPKRVLDVGCGTGFVARNLIAYVDEIDAVDMSEPMLATAHSLPNGRHPHITWRAGRIEDVALNGTYGLVTAGSSFHWFDWPVVVPKLARQLADTGVLALVAPKIKPVPWIGEAMDVVRAYSTIRNFSRFDIVDELTQGGFWQVEGEHETAYAPVTQSVANYVQHWHGRASLSVERMGPERAAAFDAAMTDIVRKQCGDSVTLEIGTRIVWGKLLQHG